MDTGLSAGMCILNSFLILWQASVDSGSPFHMGLEEGRELRIIFGYSASELPSHVWDIYHFMNLSALRKSFLVF